MSRVRERREELGMKQNELLNLIRQVDPRMDIGTLSRIENGFVLPASEECMAALEKALQAPRCDLFEGLEVFAIEDAKRPVGRITMMVADAVPEGKRNAISRKELAERLGVSDRRAREWLEIAKLDGLAIANDQDGKGYYQPVTADECRRQYAQNRNRAMSILRQQKWLKARMEG